VRDSGERETAGRAGRGAENEWPRLPRVLVAEDERDVAELIRHHLTKDGYDAVLARTGPEALERARRKKPDLILLDIMIPEMNGWEVRHQALLAARAARPHPRGRPSPPGR
jgi:CheY-like chemotaxis protein